MEIEVRCAIFRVLVYASNVASACISTLSRCPLTLYRMSEINVQTFAGVCVCVCVRVPTSSTHGHLHFLSSSSVILYIQRQGMDKTWEPEQTLINIAAHLIEKDPRE